jgi:2-succinyl-6-hydroxy-2,4-cyclohexadiene-1-carboxylate synthase
LVLESANPGIEDDKERTDRAALDDLRAEQIERKGLATFVEHWYNAPLFDSLQNKPEKLALLKQSRLGHDPHALAAALRGLSVGRQPSLWNEIARLDLPTLVITGALDNKYCDIANKMAAQLPRCRQIIIGNAGHNTHFEQPQEFLARLREFLHDIDA